MIAGATVPASASEAMTLHFLILLIHPSWPRNDEPGITPLSTFLILPIDSSVNQTTAAMIGKPPRYRVRRRRRSAAGVPGASDTSISNRRAIGSAATRTASPPLRSPRETLLRLLIRN